MLIISVISIETTMITCANPKCQQAFSPRTHNQKFCSSACGIYTRIKKWRQKNTKPCPDCKIERISYQAEKCLKCHRKETIHFTQDKTLGDFLSLSSVRNGHPAWRYNHIRSLARYHYQHLLKKPCHICGYDKHVVLCHIRAIADFPMSALISEINAPTNVIQLCPNHHWELDNNLLSAAE